MKRALMKEVGNMQDNSYVSRKIGTLGKYKGNA